VSVHGEKQLSMAFRFAAALALSWALQPFAQDLQAKGSAAASVSASMGTTLTTTLTKDFCINMSFDFHSGTWCTYDDIINAMESILADFNESQKCPHKAAKELKMHLGVKRKKQAKKKIADICRGLQVQEFMWQKIVTGRGEDFDKTYFAGGGPWNLDVETQRYGHRINHLKDDARRVKHLYHSFAQTSRITWPGFVDSLAECKLRAATCCWTGDRQANDNNGGCQTPYDKNCVDKMPADNTDVCLVNGSSPKLGSLNNEQVPIHCHGIAWSSNELDHSSFYKGNNLFYASMYDHLHQRGYVKNIPGAPMCGCVENMPVVSRSDCTQMDIDTTFRFTPSAAGPSITLQAVDIDFNSCQGTDNRNNDLYFHYKRLVQEGKATKEELTQLQTFIKSGFPRPGGGFKHGCPVDDNEQQGQARRLFLV